LGHTRAKGETIEKVPTNLRGYLSAVPLTINSSLQIGVRTLAAHEQRGTLARSSTVTDTDRRYRHVGSALHAILARTPWRDLMMTTLENEASEFLACLVPRRITIARKSGYC